MCNEDSTDEAVENVVEELLKLDSVIYAFYVNSGSYLTRIPINLHELQVSRVTPVIIDLSNNAITAIYKGDLDFVVPVSRINILSNCIRYIEPCALDGKFYILN